MMNFIIKHWPIIVAIVTVIGYLFEKGYHLFNESKKERIAYNKIFNELVKLYLKYLQNKELFSEKPYVKLNNKDWSEYALNTHDFQKDINDFIAKVNEQSNLIPEINYSFFLLLEALDKFYNLEKMDKINRKTSEELLLATKRALFTANSSDIDNIFINLIDVVGQKALSSKKLRENLKQLNEPISINERRERKRKTFKSYIESLSRQNVIDLSAKEILLDLLK